MKKTAISLALLSSTFIGCGTVINMADYPNHLKQIEPVPSVCKNEYKSLMQIPKVAVMKFTNNSSFSKANTTTTNGNADYSHSAAAGIVVGEGGAAVAEAGKSHVNAHTNIVKRVVDPKLDKAISSALEGSLVQMGGVKIYSRNDLDKIMKEQKLEQNGLFDEKTLVKLGKLAGVKYIVTGSIDSVTQEYKDYEKVANAAGDAVSKVNGKKIRLGSYDTEDEAGKVYNDSASKYFGEYANLNIIPDGVNPIKRSQRTSFRKKRVICKREWLLFKTIKAF